MWVWFRRTFIICLRDKHCCYFEALLLLWQFLWLTFRFPLTHVTVWCAARIVRINIWTQSHNAHKPSNQVQGEGRGLIKRKQVSLFFALFFALISFLFVLPPEGHQTPMCCFWEELFREVQCPHCSKSNLQRRKEGGKKPSSNISQEREFFLSASRLRCQLPVYVHSLSE